MKKIFFVLVVVITTIHAETPAFSPALMCNGIAKGFANAYKMTEKNEMPDVYCSNIAQENAQNNLICSIDKLIDGCIKQIEIDSKK